MADEIPNISGGPHLQTVAMPRDTNALGSIVGGWTVSQMHLAGGTFEVQRVQGQFATVSIEATRFLQPISVGDEVSVYCTLQDEGDTSIAVKIETWARDRSGTNPEKVTEGVFTYVALNEHGKPHSRDARR